MTRDEATAEILKAVRAADWRARWFPRIAEAVVNQCLSEFPKSQQMRGLRLGEQEVFARGHLRRRGRQWAEKKYRSVWLAVALALIQVLIPLLIEWWKRDTEAAFGMLEEWK